MNDSTLNDDPTDELKAMIISAAWSVLWGVLCFAAGIVTVLNWRL